MHLTGTLLMRIAALLLIVMVAGLQNPPAVADADAEREALARVLHELDVLAPLIAEAENAADPDARIRFRYDWLRNDLARVGQGIAAHIDAPRAGPRTVPPLRGDYRR